MSVQSVARASGEPRSAWSVDSRAGGAGGRDQVEDVSASETSFLKSTPDSSDTLLTIGRRWHYSCPFIPCGLNSDATDAMQEDDLVYWNTQSS